MGPEAAIDQVPTGKNIYLTVDVDAMDPVQMPGTGTPAPGGLYYFEMRDALIALAKRFHAYYNRNRILVDDPAVTRARLCLAKGVQAAAADPLASIDPVLGMWVGVAATILALGAALSRPSHKN